MSNDKKVEPETTLFRTFSFKGLELRDYFAAKAMQALITSMHEHDISEYSEIAHDAYLAADAMLAERER